MPTEYMLSVAARAPMNLPSAVGSSAESAPRERAVQCEPRERRRSAESGPSEGPISHVAESAEDRRSRLEAMTMVDAAAPRVMSLSAQNLESLLDQGFESLPEGDLLKPALDALLSMVLNGSTSATVSPLAVVKTRRERVPEQELLELAKTNDPKVTCVDMWQDKTVDVPPGSGHEIFTHSLSGCTAVALLTLHADGTRSISLSHFPPLFPAQHEEAVRMALRSPSHAKDATRYQVFIVTPGEYQKDESGKYTPCMAAKFVSLVRGLVNAVHAVLPDVTPSILPYSEGSKSGRSSAFIFRIPASEEPIRYDGLLHGRCDF